MTEREILSYLKAKGLTVVPEKKEAEKPPHIVGATYNDDGTINIVVKPRAKKELGEVTAKGNLAIAGGRPVELPIKFGGKNIVASVSLFIRAK